MSRPLHVLASKFVTVGLLTFALSGLAETPVELPSHFRITKVAPAPLATVVPSPAQNDPVVHQKGYTNRL